jgi:hypothetical protein
MYQLISLASACPGWRAQVLLVDGLLPTSRRLGVLPVAVTAVDGGGYANLEANFCHSVPNKWCMFAAVHLDGVEAGVSGLPGDGGSVGTVTGALGDEASTERMSTESGESCGVITGVSGAAADGLVNR